MEPETSETSSSYNEALDEFYQKHYKAALPLFQDVQDLYPDHPYVGKFIDQTNAGIANGEDETPAAAKKDEGGLSGWLIPVVGVVVLLALLVVAGLWCIWPSADMTATAAAVLVYLPAGIYWEEKKLIRQFGDAYRNYSQRVKRLIPGVW